MCSLRFENNFLTIEGVRFASISKKTPLSKLLFAFVSLALPLLDRTEAWLRNSQKRQAMEDDRSPQRPALLLRRLCDCHPQGFQGESSFPASVEQEDAVPGSGDRSGQILGAALPVQVRRVKPNRERADRRRNWSLEGQEAARKRHRN